MACDKAGVVAAALSCLLASQAPASQTAAPAGGPAPVEWVAIQGGTFKMGTNEGGTLLESAAPTHSVTVRSFEMSRTLVTVEQYGVCVSKGQCTEPKYPGSSRTQTCNWTLKGRQRHPVNCVDWEQANQYARFAGARLPSEAEWEYAARSGGRSQRFPWGDEKANCAKAVMSGGGIGCANGTMPVCSKPTGNTAQGLCDMAGNVWQWMQDEYRSTYANAPIDGSALRFGGSNHVIRGGSFNESLDGFLRVEHRRPGVVSSRNFNIFGFRLARSRR